MALVVKNLPASERDIRDFQKKKKKRERFSFYPWIRKIPWKRADNPPQFYCLQNAMDRGVWWAIVHRVTQIWTQLSWLSTHVCNASGEYK